MAALGTLLGGFEALVMLAVTLAAGLVLGWRRVIFSPLGVAVDLAGHLACLLLLAGGLWWLMGFEAEALLVAALGALALLGLLRWLLW